MKARIIKVSLVVAACCLGVSLVAGPIEQAMKKAAAVNEMTERYLPDGHARVIICRSPSAVGGPEPMAVTMNGERLGEVQKGAMREFTFAPRADGKNTLELEIPCWTVTFRSGAVDLLALPGNTVSLDADPQWLLNNIDVKVKPDAQGGDGSLKLSYKPPVVPVAISVNSAGEIAIEAEASVVTPIGTFALGGDYTLTPREHVLYVVIRDRRKGKDGTDTIYSVRTGEREVSFVFVGRTRIGIKDHRITIDVSDGTEQKLSIGDEQ
jgi:hypothetical protein